MRKKLTKLLLNEMKHNESIIVLTGDLGYGVLDPIKKKHNGKQYFNVGIREQAMIGMAAGLSIAGCLPICFSITPFLLYRPFEFIRNDLVYNKLPAILVGTGRGKEYGNQGFTHWCEEEDMVTKALGISVVRPTHKDELDDIVPEIIKTKVPIFLSMSRFS